MEVTTNELETLATSCGPPASPHSASRADCLKMLIAAYEGRRP